jgi:hypothetical protein
MEPRGQFRRRWIEMRNLVVTLAAVPAAAAVGAGVARAAAPRIVIMSGKPLKHQIVISNWPSIASAFERMASGRVARRTQLAHRPRLKVSMFWGPRWIGYLRKGKLASALRPKQADQFGSFYPAWRGRPAMIDLPWAGRWPRVVPAKALATLERFGFRPDSAGRRP